MLKSHTSRGVSALNMRECPTDAVLGPEVILHMRPLSLLYEAGVVGTCSPAFPQHLARLMVSMDLVPSPIML